MMADLEYQDETAREGWLVWAIELARRGLLVAEDTAITVHGPHGQGADLMWGESEACDVSGFGWEVEFHTCRGISSIWDVRSVRVWEKTAPSAGEATTFPLVRASELPEEWRATIRRWRRERRQLREAA